MATEKFHPIPRRVLIITILLAFAMWLPLLVVPPLESIIVSELGISHAQVSLLYSGPIIVVAAVAIPAGFMADRIGIKKTAGIGAIIIVLGTAFRGISGSFTVILAFTLLYGLGLGLSFPNLPKLVGHCTPRERAHITTAIFITGVLASGGISVAITTPVIYPLTNSLNGTFLLWSIPPIIAAALWWWLIGDPPCRSAAVGELGMNMVALRRILRNRALWLVAVLFLLHNFFFYTWAGWIISYLTTLGSSTNMAGIIMSVIFWVAIPWVIVVTRLSYKLRLRKPFLWATSMALALVSWGALDMNVTSSWFIMAACGIAASTRFTTILSLPVELVPPEQAGTASGLVMAVGYAGALIGPYLAGRILDMTGSFYPIVLSLIAVSVLTAGLAFLMPETGANRA